MPSPEYQEFSNKQLSFGLWFTRNRVLIKAILLSAGFLIFGGLTIYNAKVIIDFYGYQEIDRLQTQILQQDAAHSALLQRYQPRDLVWQSANVIKRGTDNAYDIMVRVTNPNTDYRVVALSVQFTASAWMSEPQTIFLLPGEQKTIMLLQVTDNALVQALASGRQVQTDILTIDWQRVRGMQRFDANYFPDLGLEAINSTTQQIGQTTRELRFDIQNTSPYNYREVSVRTQLLDGTRVVAAGTTIVNDVLSGETKSVALRWFYPLPRVTSWRIEFSTDVFAEDALLPFRAEQFTNP